MTDSSIPTTLPVHPAALVFPLLEDDELDRLADDIRKNGLLHPLITFQGQLLDGRNRLIACERAWVAPRYTEYTGDDPIAYVISANVERRHLDASQLACVAVKFLPLLEEQGRERMLAGKAPDPMEIIPQGPARDIAAAMMGVNPHYVSDAKRLFDEAPATFDAVESGALGLPAAMREHKREENRRVAEATPSVTTHTAGQRYRTIVIDPPWDAEDEGDVDQMGRAQPTYATMPLAEVAALPVADVSEPDGSHLYLWITNRSLPKGFALMKAWGFRYVTTLTWCKPTLGIGNYYRNNTEHVLFGVRGSLSLLYQDTGTWFEAKRQGQHSTKPEEFYEMVRRLSPGPRLEMFARGEREGFATWGAEA
jgi:N6-adenosine-specific RNA methylase IME4